MRDCVAQPTIIMIVNVSNYKCILTQHVKEEKKEERSKRQNGRFMAATAERPLLSTACASNFNSHG